MKIPKAAAVRKLEAGPGNADQGNIASSAAQHRGVDGHRPAPAESNDKEHERAGRLQVLEGVQCDTTHRTGGVVAEAAGDPCVAEFVDAEGDEEADTERGQKKRHEAQGRAGVLSNDVNENEEHDGLELL